MSIYRSEKMMLYHIAMSKESAYEVLSELGDLGIVQFQDENPTESHYTRPFSRQIKRCEDIEANIQLIIQQSKLYEVDIQHQKNMNEYLENVKRKLENRGKAHHTYLDQIEEEVEIKAQQLSENIQNLEKFKIQINQLHEYKAVLNQFKTTLAENIYGRQGLSYTQDEENNEGILTDSAMKINFLAGIIDTADLLRFKRMVFRSTRGNCFIESSDVTAYQYSASQQEQSLEDPKTQQLKEAIAKPKTKSSFIIIFSGGQTNAIQNKIIRIADSFQASRYQLPTDPSQYMKKMMQIEEQILEQQNTMNMTERSIAKMVSEWAQPQNEQESKADIQQCSSIEYYRLFIKREKLLYTNMNLLNIKNEIYEGHYWAPELLANNIDKAIRALHNRRINLPQTTITPEDFKNQVPPTYFQTNEFTGVFQQIVDTYGIARYQEINPGIFCVSMFPLKFGVMFGDIGHGGLLLIVGILITYFSDVLKKNGLESVAEVRYLILLMGICAFYCGFIYNDFFAIPWKLFGTCFENVEGSNMTAQIPGCVHPLGLDPKWYVSKNELTFMNSFKMKMAVIIGVVQMGWGVILKGCNHMYQREWIEFIFEFIPQIVFLTVTFGYMDFLIFYKWATDFTGENSAMAPSIISQMINLPLKLGSTEGFPLWEADSQENIQYWLLIISLICVPLMLFPKPFILLLKSKMQEKPHHDTTEIQQPLIEGKDDEGNLTKKLQTEIAKQGHGHGHGHGEEFEFGEVFVHQVIETIEFVLGCISNTASYLRLWALSLAHGQLSKVFFTKTIGGGIQSGDILSIFIGWFLFVNITLGVIMAMDLMECFLHALRLQWVEFQNKFYKADGYAFQPFSFVKNLKNDEI